MRTPAALLLALLAAWATSVESALAEPYKRGAVGGGVGGRGRMGSAVGSTARREVPASGATRRCRRCTRAPPPAPTWLTKRNPRRSINVAVAGIQPTSPRPSSFVSPPNRLVRVAAPGSGQPTARAHDRRLPVRLPGTPAGRQRKRLLVHRVRPVYADVARPARARCRRGGDPGRLVRPLLRIL